jgi:hypothetical protein
MIAEWLNMGTRVEIMIDIRKQIIPLFMCMSRDYALAKP